jgi:hypothetical protein
MEIGSGAPKTKSGTSLTRTEILVQDENRKFNERNKDQIFSA